MMLECINGELLARIGFMLRYDKGYNVSNLDAALSQLEIIQICSGDIENPVIAFCQQEII